ncbi:MAG: hypothetical protein ACM3JE_01985 [Betaproteobacteria bacterium]
MSAVLGEEQKLLELYHEANATQRNLLEISWKQPATLVGIAVAVVLAGYLLITDAMVNASIEYQVLRTFLVIFGALLAFTSAQTATKHMYRRTAVLGRIHEIETKLKLQTLSTPEKNSYWERLNSTKLLIGSVLILSAGFSVLAAANTYFSAVVLEPYLQALSTTVNFWLEVVGLIAVFIGAILLTLTEIPTSFKKSQTTYIEGKYQAGTAEQKSKSSIIATIIIAVGFLLELIGMAIS